MKNSRAGSARLRGCVVALLMGVGMPASAATHVVTTTADSGPGSLRQAVTQAIASPENDEIVFQPAADGVITLQSALPDLLASGGDLTLAGNGAARTIIDGAGQYRLLQAHDQSNWHLTLRALTLRNASSGAELRGGAVLMQGGSNAALTIDGVEFVDNFATQHGAAIYAHAAMHIENSLIIGSQLSGFFVGGTLFCADAPLLMRNTTIAASRAGTVSGNLAQSSLFLDGTGCTARLVNSTVVDSGAMNAIGVQNASLSLSNTLAIGASYGHGVAVSGSGTLDIAGSRNNIMSGDDNVAGLVDGVNGNQVNRAPLLAGPLGDRGGPVRTLPLLPGSPALDAGSAIDADVPATDARGMTRIGAPDVGAFESRGFLLQAASFADQSTLVGTSFPDHLEFQVTALDPGEPVEGGHVQLVAPATGASATVVRVRQVIDASGHASLLLRANDEAGGPYTVGFTVNGPTGDPLPEVRLDNRALQCGSHGDTYAVAGADNHARLSNLREAMHCRNQTGQPAIIDLGQQTLVFEDGPYESLEIEGSFGALPPLTRTIELRNGALERNALSPETFRFIEGAIDAGLTLDGISMANGNGIPFGGAVYTVRSGVIRILDSHFTDNTSASGGALYLQSDESLEIANSRFTGNQSTGNAGAAWFYSANGSSIHDSHFEDNHAGGKGGALYTLSAPNVLHGNVFAANTAGTQGGAISGDGLEIAMTLFRGNHARDGGAIHSNDRADSSYPLRVGSSVFAHNSAERFPVLYVPRAVPAFIDNVTVVGNTATVGSTLFGIDDTTTDPVATQVRNSIIWGNPGLTCGDALLERSLVEGGDAGGTGIIDADPRFVDAANDDWRLGADSPAIDAGDNAFVASGTTDLDGLPRRFDDPAVADTGAGTAPIVDLGAYERQTGIGACADFTFPYTLSGADNAARVIELRQAIECANANATDDEIGLGGNTLVFSDAPYTDANGTNALPIVTGTLILGNGALERATSAPAFRFLDVAADSDLSVRAMQLHNGLSDSEGGAIRADGMLTLQDNVFEDNRAATRGGAVATHAATNIYTSRFARNTALDGAAIAGGDDDAIPGGDVTLVINSRFEGNGDSDSRSVIWNKSYLGMIGSLVADNHLTAVDSSLMFFHDDNAVAELRNVTIADNAVQGALFSWALSNVQLHNVIVWDNQYASLGNVSPTNSILPGVPAVNGNLDQSPGFVSTPGDYHLDAGSPAIDAGDNSYGAFEDLDLNPRPLDDAGVADTGNGNAPIVDMGAYEYQTDSVAAGITITPTSGLVTTESGGTANFTVVLDRYPTANVTLVLTSSNLAEGVVVPANRVFTQANWNQPQTVTVTGVDDGVIDGDQAYTIFTVPAFSADPAYAGIDAPDVQVVNQDDEAPTHNLGGTVVGLLGSGLELSLNADEILPLAADGSFTFATMLAPGEIYAITVAVQPQDPAQACVVINGSGTMGAIDIDNVVVNCGASVSYTVGGTLDGLAGGGLVLQLNGSGDLALSADGSYAFVPRLVDGAGYVVTVRTQPQGQLCTLANATGTVQGADVADVDVSCAPLQANLQLGVDDGHAFARYGHVRDYFVTLGNTGNAAATDVAIAATLSAAFDVANVQWQCIGGGGGASCGSDGAGGFSDSATVPANSSVTWIVSVPVLAGSNETEATITVSADAPAGASVADAADTDTLVLFRDGVDVPYGDGTQGDMEPADLRGEQSLPIEWLPADAEGIRSVRTLETPGGAVEVQRLTVGGADFVRLLGTDAVGQQQASEWTPMAMGARLVVGHVGGAGNAGIVLLEGAMRPLALPQGERDNNGEIE